MPRVSQVATRSRALVVLVAVWPHAQHQGPSSKGAQDAATSLIPIEGSPPWLSVPAIACFRDPDQMRAAAIELIEQGFDANVLDEIDDKNAAAIWIAINTIVTTEFDCTGFVDWTDHAIQPFRGVVVQIETFGAEE